MSSTITAIASPCSTSVDTAIPASCCSKTKRPRRVRWLTRADWPRSSPRSPLFGLPGLLRVDLPAKPYRHVECFRREDAEVFFGRGQDIAALFRRVTGPDGDPVLLFYGQSGVGKSSVLDAGLLPRLEQVHEV